MAPKGDPMMSKALCDAQMKPIIMALYGDGNGNPGLIKRTNLIWDGVREAAGVEKERLRSQTAHEKAVKDKLDAQTLLNAQSAAELSEKVGKKNAWIAIAAVLVSLAGVVVTIAGIIVSVYVVRHSELSPLEIFQTTLTGQVYDAQYHQPPQDATAVPR